MTSVVAYESIGSDRTVIIRNSVGGMIVSDDANALLRFLRYDTAGCMKVAWDLDTFFAPILRLLPEDILVRLAAKDESLNYRGTELYHMTHRLFRVHKARYYGIREFWGTTISEKMPLDEVQEMATDLITTLYRLGLKRPEQQPIRKLTSPVAVFEDSEWGEPICRSLPTSYDMPEYADEATEFASKADRRAWVSNHQVGHFLKGEIWDYDRASAYPYEASQLPDTRDLTWWKSSKLGPREILSTLGVVHGSFTLNPDAEFAHASPIMTSGEADSLAALPMGHLPADYYTMDEVRHVLANKLGSFKLKEGWFAEPTEGVTVRYPLRDLMPQLYDMRNISPLAGTVCKGIANQLVGKQAETMHDAAKTRGPMFNAVWHCHVIARNRIAVSRFLIENRIAADQLVCVQTDGVKLTVDIPLPTNGLGNWVNKGSANTLIASPNKVYTGTARPYQMTYNEVVELITERPLAKEYSKTNRHTTTLKEAIRGEDITRVGEVIDLPTSLDLVYLPAEQNREYPKMPTNGKALLSGKYHSSPVIL